MCTGTMHLLRPSTFVLLWSLMLGFKCAQLSCTISPHFGSFKILSVASYTKAMPLHCMHECII